MPQTGRERYRRRVQRDTRMEAPPPPPSLNTRAHYMRRMDEPPSSTLSELLQHSQYPNDPETYIHPATRLLELAMIHGEEAAWDQLQAYLLEFQLKRFTIDRIAKNLDVDYNAAKQIMKDFKKRVTKKMETLEVNDLMYRSMGIYDYIQSEMTETMSRENATLAEKCIAIDRILRSEKDRYAILAQVNYLARKEYIPKQVEDNGAVKQSNLLKDMIKGLIAGTDVEDTDAYTVMLEPCDEGA